MKYKAKKQTKETAIIGCENLWGVNFLSVQFQLSIFRFFMGSAAIWVLLIASNSYGQTLVQVSTGYYDLPPGSGGSNLPLPNPWVNSSNTVFYGSTANAMSGDPDESAILIQNLGSSPVALTALNVGDSIDLFSLAYGNITGTVPLNPGTNYIFAAFDGSDVSFTSVVNLTLGSQNYSYGDAIDPTLYPSGVLHGFPNSTDETVPWTVISTPIPESSAYAALFGSTTLGFAVCIRRRGRRSNVGESVES